MIEQAYEIKLTKSKMTEILSVFKKALMLGNKFILSGDIIVIPKGYTTVNGTHCIAHGLDIPGDGELDNVQYVSTDNIEARIKNLTDAKGISSIVMGWSPHYLDVCITLKTGETVEETLALGNMPTVDESFGEMLPTQNRFEVLYNDILSVANCNEYLTENDLRNIGMGKVVELKDGKGGIVRISKNLFPCLGTMRKGTVPNMNVRVKTYEKNGNNILAMIVKYKDITAAHVYYYDPIMVD